MLYYCVVSIGINVHQKYGVLVKTSMLMDGHKIENMEK